MTNPASEQLIQNYLNASEKPFNNRLQVVCYLWLGENLPRAQEKQQALAKDLARFIEGHVFVDVDRQ